MAALTNLEQQQDSSHQKILNNIAAVSSFCIQSRARKRRVVGKKDDKK